MDLSHICKIIGRFMFQKKGQKFLNNRYILNYNYNLPNQPFNK
jgi:hypothetical protein